MTRPPPRSRPYDLEDLRTQEFPWASETVYLNHASIGPLPARTLRALDAFNRRRATPSVLSDSELLAILAESRRLAGTLIGAPAETIALSTNTSYGLTLAAGGLPLEPGDIVVASDREFPANVYPWMRLQDRHIEFELVPVTSQGWPDMPRLLERLQDPRVRVLAISLVQFSTGYCADLSLLSQATRATDTFLVVDAIQGLGHVPVDVFQTPVDVLSAGGQKWLLSPWGSGFVYVREELLDTIDPPVTGWLSFEGSQDFTHLTDYDSRFLPDARRFELATIPYQDFAGMNASLELLLSLGIENIHRHVELILAPFRSWCAQRGLALASPVDAHRSGIVCLAPPDPVGAFELLRTEGIVCSLREGTIRLSPHGYTTTEEMERVMDVLGRVR